ncbi:GntR family transcriptional regulator [Arthrobacter sp. NPDC057009]|uniref:GntR family transcriptional regulator n=1 Tax=Arthrobacter sp. NPDC057009 TaxID=3345996 RepID=UPI003632BB14
MKEASGLVDMTPQSTSVKIADLLRERIVDGYFAPGQQVNEAQVSAQLNLSRGPVREALQRLSQEGLLVSKPNRGVFVVELTADDVDEIYGAREIIELGAAELIANQSGGKRNKTASRLKKIASRLTEAATSDDWQKVRKLDLEFHTTLVSESGNSRLLRAYTTLATEALICMKNLERAYPTPSSVTHHLVMAELIATGSMKEIRSSFHRHLSLGEST